MIEKYEFSSITINGKHYNTDVIVTPKGVSDNWWREDGHKLTIFDIEKVLKDKPEAVVIGTGQDGKMRIMPEVLDYVKKNNIDFIATDTAKAITEYNKLEKEKIRVIGCFHLTC
jgi:hypothetical protein